MKEISERYQHEQVEDRWYNYWLEKGYFYSIPDSRESYTIVMPPPNITGVLHMGHMLNNTIQDVLIRRARMKGYNACWIPGIDHASIATESKVVKRLKDRGIEKKDLTREEFLEYAWEWKQEHGDIILNQLKKIGVSCDWKRTKFTMDEDISESVCNIFISLHEQGLLYREYRMINWDPQAQTTISDEEVIHIQKKSKLFYIKYRVENTDQYVVIATTRPETILGDTAICINPNDSRYSNLKGKNVIVPITNRPVPVIEDEYVDVDFGTGCLKITPCHDVNDKKIGDKHKLQFINIFNDDATLNENGLHYRGKDRFAVRKEIVEELKSIGLLEKVEDYDNSVGVSERTGCVIEPKISCQWFLKMKTMANVALKSVSDGEISLVPDKYKNTYNHWLKNIRDWNISRQLWWGHQIPVYYYGEGINDYVVAKNIDEALVLAKDKNDSISERDLIRDEDVLDTWFSSWLWPIVVFDGIRNPNNADIEYYYPTRELVTGPDIIFFWVARMIMAGYHWTDKKPFKDVYFTGIVRDKEGKKMSKSLGNSPDPLSLIKEYGADAVRTGLLFCSSVGNDLLFDEKLCLQGRNFANKIWNAFRLIKSWEVSDKVEIDLLGQRVLEWFDVKSNKVLKDLEFSYSRHRISESLMILYKFIWDDFCSYYLELVKPKYGEPIDEVTYSKTVENFEKILKILHPFMPFITEDIWQSLSDRTVREAIIISSEPEIYNTIDDSLLPIFDNMVKVVSSVRNIRKKNNVPNRQELELFVMSKKGRNDFFDGAIIKLCNVRKIESVTNNMEGSNSFIVDSDEYFIPLSQNVDSSSEVESLQSELEYFKGFLSSIEKKMNNDNFVKNAPKNVVDMERKKHSDTVQKINMIEHRLKSLEI
ncbi:valine--tRNA ligase [Ichthyobacterium seriolicida]|uniref:Valine--tRNA ligase n=1 Tax=Ichthyobacterium seriolicida TaxID=242600 RepID=A0A1J1DZJ3_9FLAO|nr:valine--tRNA ligase [Ichthyobacterium seriolicida]BAV95313.1 valyl-tRNA synthetase [Ichthyobacterium seriolicida]